MTTSDAASQALAQQRETRIQAEAEQMRIREAARLRVRDEQLVAAAAQRRLRMVTGEDFLALDEEEEPPIWGAKGVSLWAAGEPLMIFGPNGVGKSTLSHLLVWARLGLIEQVLDMPVEPGEGKVLYLAADRPKQIRRAMRRLYKPAHRDVIRERLVVHEGPLPFDITTDKDALADLAQSHGATTVFVDSLKDVCAKPSDEVSANGYNSARQECVARGIEWVEDHHNRKANGDNRHPNTIEDVYGSRWLTAGAGSVICLWGETGADSVKLTHLKSPGEMLADRDITIDRQRGLMGASDVVDLATFIESQPFVVVADVAAFLAREKGVSVTEQVTKTARQTLDRDVKRGVLMKSSGQSPVRYWYNAAHRPTRGDDERCRRAAGSQSVGHQVDGLGEGWQ